jgi:hypothetical protein
MQLSLAIVLAILLLCICYASGLFNGLKYSAYNTQSVAPCIDCETYQVHKAHVLEADGADAAAKILKEINKRNQTLIAFLEKKYMKTASVQLDPTKNNRIDVISGSELYESGGSDVAELLRNPINREYIQERVVQLLQNYDSKQMYEISPKNTGNATSYTEDKKVLVLCLRQKQPNSDGQYPLHDINTLMFVVLHELSHMANKSWGHAVDFWVLFKFLLLNGVEADIYKPVDYHKHPINYCGLWLYYNPLFDNTL